MAKCNHCLHRATDTSRVCCFCRRTFRAEPPGADHGPYLPGAHALVPPNQARVLDPVRPSVVPSAPPTRERLDAPLWTWVDTAVLVAVVVFVAVFVFGLRHLFGAT